MMAQKHSFVHVCSYFLVFGSLFVATLKSIGDLQIRKPDLKRKTLQGSVLCRTDGPIPTLKAKLSFSCFKIHLSLSVRSKKGVIVTSEQFTMVNEYM